jgi:hypothetical protein
MFELLNLESRDLLASYCCTGDHCGLGVENEPEKMFFHLVPGKESTEDGAEPGHLSVWLRLGYIEEYVMSEEMPCCDAAHIRVVESLSPY